MRIVAINVFKFEELSDKAKRVARLWWMDCGPCDHIYHEFTKQVAKVEDVFKISIRNWSMGPLGHSSQLDDDDFDPKCVEYITQNCIDNADTYEYVFLKTLKDTNNLRESVNAMFQSAVDDCAYQYTDECIDENIIANEYEFLENGKRFVL